MTMTYGTLQDQIKSYLDRLDADTLLQIPNFIYQAEQRICRESKNVGLEAYITGNFYDPEPGRPSVIAKPSRWRRNLSFTYGSGTGNNTTNQLFLRAYEYLRNYWPDATQTSPPLYYADFGYDHLLIAPTPDQNYPFLYCYLQLPEPLSNSVSTNWITDNAPDVLLYASLLEAVPYLKNDERIPVWQALYDRGLASLNAQDDQRIYDRASNRKAD